MSDNTKGWTADRVRRHLANAVYLEMWTVPLYLTSAYSVDAPVNPTTLRPEFAPVPTNPDGSPDFARFTPQDYNQYAFNTVLSVAIQEMLHVELAANLLNAVRPSADSTPVAFTGAAAPDLTRPPSVIDAPLPDGVALKLGPLDVNQTRLFQWVEEERAESGDPEAYRDTYDSIGNFYTSLAYGLKACWAELYPPENLGPDPTADELRQKDDWESAAMSLRSGFLAFAAPSLAPTATSAQDVLTAASRYDFSIRIYGTPADALTRAEAAMTAIKVQGEGAGQGGLVPAPFVPTDGDPIEIYLDRFSHWQRFTDLLGPVTEGKVAVYDAAPTADLGDLQKALNESYSSFLASLDAAYGSAGSVGLEAMRGLGNRTLQVWQNGGVPEYAWSDPSSAVDPTRSHDFHACQGLNMCAGKGANGTGTKPGDGDCATAWFHTCSQTNICAGQGGCGYAGVPDKPSDPDNWRPNFNSAQGNGGCGAPIPYGQIFSSGAPADIAGKCVWTYARALMREKVPGFPADDPEPDSLRKLLTPTSAGTTPPPEEC